MRVVVGSNPAIPTNLNIANFAGSLLARSQKFQITQHAFFPVVLNRYVATIKNFQTAREKLGLKIGNSKIIEGSALDLPLEDNSIDGVITSTPYSFAIDYVDNVEPQLKYLGYDPVKLKANMIGYKAEVLPKNWNFTLICLIKSSRSLQELLRKEQKQFLLSELTIFKQKAYAWKVE